MRCSGGRQTSRWSLLYADPVLRAHPPARSLSRLVRLRGTVRMFLRSLSARLLILTIFFVMVGEVLIFVPSVARFRMTYFENRLAAGNLATIALAASPTGHLNQDLSETLLAHVGARGVALYRADGTVLKLDSADPPQPDATIDLTHPDIFLAIRGSFRTLFGDRKRVLRVLGSSTPDSAETVEVLLDEA